MNSDQKSRIDQLNTDLDMVLFRLEDLLGRTQGDPPREEVSRLQRELSRIQSDLQNLVDDLW